ncbi:MAG: hypothetical protein WCO35_01045 [Candidatus Nomurabacteria bacterium]
MYKTFTAEDFKKQLNLPLDYQVEGFISYGGWMEEKQREEIESVLKESNISYSLKILEGFLSHVLEIKINNKNYWFVVMYGGAMLSEFVHLACLFGSKKNIHLGSCGGLEKDINSLDLIIPTYSYGDESTTRIYNKEAKDFKHFSDEKLSELLQKNLGTNFSTKRGPIITNQAMLGESLEDILSWSNDGYYGVEMEISTIFAVSKYFNVPSTALVYVSDNLIKGQTVGDESHTNEKEKRTELRKNILKAGLFTVIE